VRQFYVSRSDNRSAKLQIQNKRRNGYDEVVLVFSNVHKLFHFAALLSITDDYPNYRPITWESVAEQSEESKEVLNPALDEDKDFKVLAITWNMGGSDKDLFGNQQSLEDFLPNVTDYDLVFLSSQECLAGKMNRRIQQLELFLNQKGFDNIDPQHSFISMYQMFLIVFIKKPLMNHLSRVISKIDAKGKNVLVTTMGNKGGLCYSFVLKNNVFNIIGCHLQHKK